MLTAAALHRMDRAALMDVMRAGHPIDATALDDTVYDGTALGLPRWFERLTWKRFQKTFARDRATGALRGWNVRVGRRHGDTWGHYEVIAARGHRMPVACDAGLLIDYGRANPPPSPLAPLRDPLVAVNAGDPTLLLGWSYLDFGRWQIPTPSYFTLERAAPLTGC